MKNIVVITLLVVILPFAGCKKDTATPYVGSWTWDAVTLQLNSNNTYTITNSGSPMGSGKFAATGTQLSFTDNSGVCPSEQVGIYSYVVGSSSTNSGGYYGTTTTTPTLTLTYVSDSCTWRATNLPGPYTK